MELIMTNPHYLLIPLVTSFLFICLFTYSSSLSYDYDNHDYGYHKIVKGFSVELIHRDSPKSPFFDLSETPSQRLTNALIRSINRKNHLTTLQSSSPREAQATVYPDNGEYLMEISIGMPPFRLLAIADTGSDLTWTQCKPCTDCYNQTSLLFDSSSSSTYKNVPCKTRICISRTRPTTCETKPELCPYSIEYSDRSYSRGYLARDTLTLASTTCRQVQFPKFLFGCGKESSITFDQNAGSGIVGLGNGKDSLVSQLGFSIGGKFSYCLVPYTDSKKSSKMNFGRTAVVSGPGSVSTPLFLDVFPETFYHLTLEGISVGDTKLRLPGGSSDEGNIIIDSGTTLTILPSDFYSDLESAVAKEINLERIEDPTGFLSLCYKSPESESTDFHAPILTVHFSAGADVKLRTLNTFVRVSEDAVCFAFVGYGSGSDSVYGNLVQMNFLVGYDIQKKMVSFKPTDCSKM